MSKSEEAESICPLDAAIKEMLSLWAMWRQLGFTADEIFVALNPIGGESACHVGMVLVVQGKQFAAHIGKVGELSEDVEKEWRAAANRWGEWSSEERKALVESSNVFQARVGMLVSIAGNGIKIPISENREEK